MINSRLSRHIHVEIFKFCETHDLKSLQTFLKGLERRDLAKHIDWNCETDFGGFLEVAAIHSFGKNLKFIRFLIEKGCDVNYTFEGKMTAIMYSVMAGCLPLTQYFIDIDAELETTSGVSKRMITIFNIVAFYQFETQFLYRKRQH